MSSILSPRWVEEQSPTNQIQAIHSLTLTQWAAASEAEEASVVLELHLLPTILALACQTNLDQVDSERKAAMTLMTDQRFLQARMVATLTPKSSQ